MPEVSEKWEKNWLSLAGKSISTTKNEGFVSKIHFRKADKKWFPIARKPLSTNRNARLF